MPETDESAVWHHIDLLKRENAKLRAEVERLRAEIREANGLIRLPEDNSDLTIVERLRLYREYTGKVEAMAGDVLTAATDYPIGIDDGYMMTHETEEALSRLLDYLRGEEG